MENRGGQHPELLQDVKNYLGITWEDQATDNKISGLIESGIAYLDSKRGGYEDYLHPSLSRTLLMEYVRYMRDSALDVFENNYRSMIIAMRNERTVELYVAETVSEE